ncbi:glycosyltransferase family 4 protein [Candidatus Woesearchaeota archaeon]|nr:glycosyltransferase family 4 protein [Candidatus Woesearchaeota archaeon]
MRILIINDSCREVGGAETYIFGIMKLLREQGDEVFLFSYDTEKREEDYSLIIKHKEKKARFLVNKFGFSMRVYNELKDYIKNVNPDVIHLHNNYIYSNSVLLALKKSKKPVIHHVHDWGLICPTSWSVYKKSLKVCKSVEGIQFKCLRKGCLPFHHWISTYLRNKIRIKLERNVVDLFISPSIRLRDYLKDHNMNPVIWLPQFIEFEDVEVRIPNGNILLYVGALSKNKGVEYLINAFPKIKEEIKDAKLHIVGDGPEREALEELSKGMDVKFFGRVPHDEVLEHYKHAKLLVMPSVWMENGPFVLYEGMSSGKPVIATKRGGIVDLVRDGINGFIVRAADSEAIAEKTIKLLKDKNLLKEFSKSSQKIIKEEFTTKKHLNYLNNLYKDVIEKKR